jgi:hypothetical protein
MQREVYLLPFEFWDFKNLKELQLLHSMRGTMNTVLATNANQLRDKSLLWSFYSFSFFHLVIWPIIYILPPFHAQIPTPHTMDSLAHAYCSFFREMFTQIHATYKHQKEHDFYLWRN